MRRTKKNPAGDAALPVIPSELIDQIVKGPMSADAVNAASKAFKKALIERCLGAELSHHLGYSPGAEKPEEASNHRNGTSAEALLVSSKVTPHLRGALLIICIFLMCTKLFNCIE